MSFLTLNGWEPAVADGDLSESIQETGSRRRSPSGVLGKDVTAEKLSLDLRTTALAPQDAAALAGLLRGRGHVWHYDGTLWSAGGLYPRTTYLTTAYRGPERIARAYPAADIVLPYFASTSDRQCVAVDPATTNMLSANQASVETNTAGFTAITAATLTRVTAQYWTGAASLHVEVAAVARGVLTDAVACSGATAYTGSVYLLGGTKRITVYLKDSTGATSTPKTVAVSASAWRRVEVTMTTAAGATSISLCCESAEADASEWWQDGLQIEAKAGATSWIAGASSRTIGMLSYATSMVRPGDDLTIACWTRGPTDSPAVRSAPLVRYGSSSAGVLLDAGSGTVAVTAPPTTIALAGGAWDGDWHHVAVVVRQAPASGSYRGELYFDGALVDTDTGTGTLPELATAVLFVGNDNGTAALGGVIDELIVLPWGMTAAQIAAWYDREFSDLPFLDAGGDVIGAVEREVLGRIGSTRYLQASIGGAWENRGQEIAFGLDQK